MLSRSSKGQAVGVMCTASHNPEVDNGIKLVDVDGGMMRSSWEEKATSLVNLESADEVMEYLRNIYPSKSSATTSIRQKGRVFIGFDSRVHSTRLAYLVACGAQCCGARVENVGLVTTPILHHCVYQANGIFDRVVVPCLPKKFVEDMSQNYAYNGSCGSVSSYLDIICWSYVEMLQTCPLPKLANVYNHPRLVVDCACGVGSPYIESINERLIPYQHLGAVELIAINRMGEGPLNESCGAEYVQKQQLPPKHFQPIHMYSDIDHFLLSNVQGATKMDLPLRNASLDGDADRIVFHYHKENKKFRLLDGDKIASLVALFIQSQILVLKESVPELLSEIRCGVVQTAYANGASTRFLQVSYGTICLLAIYFA